MSLERDIAVAVTRFGLGARPGEPDRYRRDPRGVVLSEIGRRDAALLPASLPPSDETLRQFFVLRGRAETAQELDARAKRDRAALYAAAPLPGMEGKVETTPPATEENANRAVYFPQLQARFDHILSTEAMLTERLVQFWTNHFAISRFKGAPVHALSLGYEREAIRAHVFGRFEDMLQAVSSHPAMILYLDNERSAGPNSPFGRQRGRSINENLAREILELHTLGVDGGYTQRDVTSFAAVLTGWHWHGPREPLGGQFIFRRAMHEPGEKTVLGETFRQEGEAQGRAVLARLSTHPSTARHIARKLVAHFVADEPPPRLVARLAAAFESSGGDLPTVYRALVTDDEAWSTPLRKLRTPFDFIVAVARGLELRLEAQPLNGLLSSFGQITFGATSPKGFPDVAADWLGAEAMRMRLAWSTLQGQRFGGRIDALARAEAILGPGLSDETRTAIRRAESRQQALTLLLMSPEMQRR